MLGLVIYVILWKMICLMTGGGSTAGLSTGTAAHYERCNNDTQCNTYGPLLIDLCKTANVSIVNGRMTNDLSGNPTFKNISTIDYFLCSPLLFKHINNFIVYDGNPLFSDRLELVLNTKVTAIQHARCHYNPGVKRTVVRWQHNQKAEFQSAINNNTEFKSVSTLLNVISTNVGVATIENVNDLVASFNDLLLNSAKKCNMLKTKKYAKINATNTSKYKDWFNADYHDKRNAFNRARRRYKDNNSKDNLKLLST